MCPSRHGNVSVASQNRAKLKSEGMKGWWGQRLELQYAEVYSAVYPDDLGVTVRRGGSVGGGVVARPLVLLEVEVEGVAFSAEHVELFEGRRGLGGDGGAEYTVDGTVGPIHGHDGTDFQ
eukprot:Hpha_TRINITY_DN15676_c0_g1::TRINITY_DN15676_c0_g1_i1::g.99862::m.99862